MVVRAGQEGVSFRFPETNFGDHVPKDVVRPECLLTHQGLAKICCHPAVYLTHQ